jgi:hypothetical protein
VRSGPGEARTILLLHIISVRPSKQPLMVRTFLKVYMELGSYFLFLQEQIKDIIIITRRRRALREAMPWCLKKKRCFTSTLVNHILRVTKPNTKRVTIICPNLLSQIGAWGLRFN